MFKSFLTKSENIERESYIWNLIGSTLNAFQSVIMLAVITRVTNLNDAGIFTIAYANSILMLNIGKYGMRNFQVSDYDSQFSFSEYKLSRLYTTLAMVSVSLIYILIISNLNDYSVTKSLTVLIMCVYKAIDSFEDVYHGLFQQENRLDIAGKALSIRMFCSIIIFSLSIFISKSLLISLIITTIASSIIFIYLTSIAYREYKIEKKPILKNVILLLKICFPLFLSVFLSFYINNAPKYAIDSILNDELQACYGFIVMPVFIIELLNGFIFNPVIYTLAKEWSKRNMHRFKAIIIKQIVIIAIITLLCESAAYIAGIPLLSMLYSTDLNKYKTDLLILLLGGGFLVLSGLFNTVLKIMRKQNKAVYIYAFISLIALIFSSKIVRSYSLRGASYLYLILMFLSSVLFIIFSIYFIKQSQK